MSILVDDNTRVVVQGITGRDGSFHARQMVSYGTKVVAGVTPGKGGQKLDSIPVYNSVATAVREQKANTSIIYVPPAFAFGAIYEALDAGIGLVICITEGVPEQDVMKIYNVMKGYPEARLIGPNCPGVITPGKCKVGIMPAHIHLAPQAGQKGVGVVSRSGTLTYEVVNALTKKGIPQSSCLGIGGDPIVGTNFIDALTLFNNDSETQAIAMIGEIGGSAEEEAAAFIKANVKKPVVSFISGRSAPPGKRMGHAGAIISGNTGTPESKLNAFKDANVPVADTPVEVADLIERKIS